ncbi:hypothetical protein D8S78_01240 [Natrialba swarupiae]|nr:hypothetical protein [Natrialba swarupiae]
MRRCDGEQSEELPGSTKRREQSVERECVRSCPPCGSLVRSAMTDYRSITRRSAIDRPTHRGPYQWVVSRRKRSPIDADGRPVGPSG